MSLMFNGPIPGQSLTTEPRAMPYERPPEIADPIEALDLHIENMSRPEAMEDALFFLEMGVDMVSLVEGILRSAVMEGIHSLDVSLIIAPVLHEYIKSYAVKADIDFDEGFDNPEQDKAIQYQRDTMRAKKLLAQLKEEEGIEPEEPPMMMEEPEEAPQEMTEEMPEEAEAPKGLMARM